MLSKELKQIIKEVKKEFLDEKIKTNQDIKDDIKENKNLYDTKIIMFKTFGVSNDIYNEFYSYSLIIREFKNELSKIFYKHFYDILKKEFTQIDVEYKSLQQQYKNLITNSRNFNDSYKEVKGMYQAIISKHFKWSKNKKPYLI